MPLVRTELLDVRTDERGALTKLWPGPVTGEVYMVELRPGSSRGHHWHRHGGEWFMAVSGEAWLVVEDPGSGRRDRIRLHGVRAWVGPGLAHALWAEEHALVLALADRLPQDDETIPWPVTLP